MQPGPTHADLTHPDLTHAGLTDADLPAIEIADLVWQPAGADAPTLDLRGSVIRVAAGETLLISGPSGAGKSTLAAACAGLLGTLLPGTLRGTLRIGGADLVAAATDGAPGLPRELLLQLGVITAGPAPRHALPRLLDDVALPLETRGLAADQLAARARAAIGAVGLPDAAAERDAGSLSGGERAQAAAASALAARPGLLIADEPLAGLDVARAEALAAHLMTQRATRVIVTHEPSPFGAATQFSAATQRVHLDHGRVVRSSFSDTASASPAHPPQVAPPQIQHAPGERGPVRLQLFAATSTARPTVPPLSFTAHAGELTLLHGETGSGKSTLLSLAAGALRLDAGERLVAADRIRFAPQDPGLLLGARTLRQLLARDESQRASEIAARLGVAELLDRPASRCSDGERRRLALVLTASAEPQLLFADEPTLGLDDAAAANVAELLHDLAARGAAVVVASHDPRLSADAAGVRAVAHPAETCGASGTSGASGANDASGENGASARTIAKRGASLAHEMLSPAPVKRFIGVSNPLTRFGLALFWFALSVLSPATAVAQGAVALPALLVAWSSGVQLISTLRLAAALAPAIAGMVLANLIGGATPEAAVGAGVRLIAFAAGSLVLLRPFEPLRLADGVLQHLRAPFAPTLTLLASAATIPSLMSEAEERRAIRRLAKAGVDPLLLADLFDSAIRAVPRLAIALEVRGVRLPSRERPASALRPSRFRRADLLLVLLSAGGLLLSVARVVIERITLGA